MIGRRTAKNTTQTGGVFILGGGRDIFCLCFCPHLIECVNKFCAGIELQICRNNAIRTRVCPNIGERAPFGRFPAQHRRTSACLCRGGAKQKRVPFSRPGEAGAMAETTGGRRPAPLVAGLLDACPVSDAAQGRTYIGLRRGPAFCRMRRQAQQSLVRHGVRTHLIRRSQKKKRKDGGT